MEKICPRCGEKGSFKYIVWEHLVKCSGVPKKDQDRIDYEIRNI